jgi:hypothetical protein
LDQSLLVDTGTELFQVHGVLYRLSEVRDELDVDLWSAPVASIFRRSARTELTNIGFY